jgi:predicted  nucleic acid-binding Zn-ribbon protein
MQKNIVSSVNRAMGLAQREQKKQPVTAQDTTEVESLKEEVATLDDDNEELHQVVLSLKEENDKLKNEIEELRTKATATKKQPGKKKKKSLKKNK